jgi:YgiT-type zinc finger domain-containing protein
MKDVICARCSECGGTVKRRTIRQEFEREGLRISVAGIRALVCARCSEVYFEPGGAQALAEAADRLFGPTASVISMARSPLGRC